MDIFESLENLNVSEGCFGEIVGLVEEYINEYIKQSTQKKLLDTTVARQNNTDNAPEGSMKDEAIKKEQRNNELTNNYFERHGSPLQKAVKRGYSKNSKEKQALLKAGWALKEDPIIPGRHNITKY